MNTLSLILLAGGTGSRFGGSVPKTFLQFRDKPVILHSYDLFSRMEDIHEIVVVCPEEYRYLFPPETRFALPGKTRRESVHNGVMHSTGDILLTHDGARPLIQESDVRKLLKEGIPVGAATLGAPVTNTIKKVDHTQTVETTLERSTLYEIYTPQLLLRSLYDAGYEATQGKTLTHDDVALAEALGHPVRIVEGCKNNLKITFPRDLKIAESLE